MTRIQRREAERKGLWEVRFILSGVPLPGDEVIVNDKLRFVRLSEKEENSHLPVRAFVKAVGTSTQVRSLAERYLKDFIGLYSNMVRSAIRIIRNNGASELPSEFVPPGTEHLGAISRLLTLVVVPPKSKEELNKNLSLAAEIMDSINFDSEAKLYLRIALDYLLNSKLAEGIEAKLINGMIAIEALFGEDRELKYRISHRVSCLLGKNNSKRERIFEAMKTLYDKRSALVHGAARVRKKDKVSWEDIKKLQSYLADSIDRFMVLSQRYSRHSILDTLDKAVVNNKKRKDLYEECENLLQEARKD